MGKTMIFVSHSISQMKTFCDKILWLDFGMVRDFGPSEEIIPKYQEFIDKWKKMSKKEKEKYRQEAMEKQKEALRKLGI